MVTRIDKAIVAGLGAGVAALATSQASGQTENGYIIAAVAAIVVGLLTFFVPNKPAPTV